MAKSLHNFLIYRLHDRALAEHGRRFLNGRLIDIGCGTKPYRDLLAPYVSAHIGLDRLDPFHPGANPDMVGTAYEIPAASNSFDSALSTAALEHLAEPELALRETHRVLKAGGVAIYTVPFFWHVHAAPWDFYRFTRYGLQHLFEKCGFEVLELKALSGFWVTFGQLFVYYLYRFHRGPLRILPVIPALGVGVQCVAWLLDRIDRAEDWTWMYLIVGRKNGLAPPPPES